MAAGSSAHWPREGYLPEWLALEDAAGGRYIMTGNFDVDVPAYNAIFAGLAQTWPAIPQESKVWDESFDSESHGQIPVRIYKPKSDNPLPLMLYFPGGGYIAGNLETEDAHCRIFASQIPCLLISVDYPKVPKVKVDDIVQVGVQALKWARARAPELGDDSSKTVIAGGSAGAFLAAQVAYQLMSEGDTTSITGLVLLFAVALHWNYNGKYKHLFTAWEDNGYSQTPVFGRELAEFIWSHYDIDFNSPRHFPLLADDLSKFPPCYIVSAEKDCFRDDGKLLHLRLSESGVPSKFDYYEGLPHYFHVFPALEVAHRAMTRAVEGARFVFEQ